MKTCLFVLAVAVVAFGQETARFFKCPDGTVVPSEIVKGLPGQCPVTYKERQANDYVVQVIVRDNEFRERLKQSSEEWQKKFDAEHERNEDELRKTIAENNPPLTEIVVNNQIAAHIRMVRSMKQDADFETTKSGWAMRNYIASIQDDDLRERALATHEVGTKSCIALVDSTIDQIK